MNSQRASDGEGFAATRMIADVRLWYTLGYFLDAEKRIDELALS
jgi:hypothetical protein